MFENQKPSVIQEIHPEISGNSRIRLFVKREDLLDDLISGNKFRKLKYNLLEAQKQEKRTILTFGGAYSNHIHAVAAAGKKFNFNTIGVIRGERPEFINPTLTDAEKMGMVLKFISRNDFKLKTSPAFIETLKKEFGDFYLIPEGGSNVLAVKGCEEIIHELSSSYDFICCCCGTGGTLAGIICGLNGKSRVLGFPALKRGEFLKKDISHLISERTKKTFHNWQLITDYHFGGYAKWDLKLVHFINQFKIDYHIQLDPIYTGKMFYGIFEMIKTDYFSKGTKILALHTGGLQGIRGFNERFGELIG